MECAGGNKGVVDDNFSEDSSSESLKNVKLDESEEERAIDIDDDFHLPVPKIGGMKNK